MLWDNGLELLAWSLGRGVSSDCSSLLPYIDFGGCIFIVKVIKGIGIETTLTKGHSLLLIYTEIESFNGSLRVGLGVNLASSVFIDIGLVDFEYFLIGIFVIITVDSVTFLDMFSF